ncbi:hypothetical protein AHAS_Ahas04G0201600 [Arachis hypogaea]
MIVNRFGDFESSLTSQYPPRNLSHVHEFTATIGIGLNTGAYPSLQAGYGGLYGRQDPPCQRCPDSMANTRMLEISINMIDACCKYFLDDLASRNQQTIRLAYMYFSFFIAVRNELGYFAVFFRRFDVMLMPREKPALPEEESRERKEEDDRWAAVKCFRKYFGP